MNINILLIIIDVLLGAWSTLRVAQLSVDSANLHFVQILLNSAQETIEQMNCKGQQYDNSM